MLQVDRMLGTQSVRAICVLSNLSYMMYTWMSKSEEWDCFEWQSCTSLPVAETSRLNLCTQFHFYIS